MHGGIRFWMGKKSHAEIKRCLKSLKNNKSECPVYDNIRNTFMVELDKLLGRV